jgi:hypothetical protein
MKFLFHFLTLMNSQSRWLHFCKTYRIKTKRMFYRKLFFVTLFFAILIILPFACKTGKSTTQSEKVDCSTVSASYSKDIAPIINSNCMPCHKAGSFKGDFSFYDGLKSVAKNGALEKRVLIKMDMPKGKGPLPEAERKKIRCWLDNGAQNN